MQNGGRGDVLLGRSQPRRQRDRIQVGQVGLGCWKGITEEIVYLALKAGYRHVPQHSNDFEFCSIETTDL